MSDWDWSILLANFGSTNLCTFKRCLWKFFVLPNQSFFSFLPQMVFFKATWHIASNPLALLMKWVQTQLHFSRLKLDFSVSKLDHLDCVWSGRLCVWRCWRLSIGCWGLRNVLVLHGRDDCGGYGAYDDIPRVVTRFKWTNPGEPPIPRLVLDLGSGERATTCSKPRDSVLDDGARMFKG